MGEETALVTGATDGIGVQTALELARRGFHVIVHGRAEIRVRQTVAALRTELPGGSFGTFVCDLSSLPTIKQSASKLVANLPRLDVLVNNAGLFLQDRAVTGDGLEMTMAVNYFAPFVLTHALLPSLVSAPAPRIVNVSSVAHTRAKLDLNALDFRQNYSGFGAYAASKLANVLFALELARRLPKHVRSHALHPGVVSTKLLTTGFGISGGSVEEGAKTSVYVASDPAPGLVTGRYYEASREAMPSAAALDVELGRKLYELSCRVTTMLPLSSKH